MKADPRDMAVLRMLKELGPNGETVDSAVLRQWVGCSAAQLRESLQRLRWNGRVTQDRIALAVGEAARPTGAELAAEVDAWIARTGVPPTRFSVLALGSKAAFNRMRGTKSPSRRTVERVRAYIAAHPDGDGAWPPYKSITPGEASGTARKAPGGTVSAVPSRPTGRASQRGDGAITRTRSDLDRVLERGQREAEKLEAARAAMRAGPPLRLTPAEQITSAMLAEPGDLVGYLKRQWPDLWREVLLSAREAGVRPAVHVVECVRRGLEA